MQCTATGIVIVLLLFRFNVAVGWTTVSGKSTFYVDFDLYDLEMKVSGVRQFDIHGSNFPGHMEFDTDSHSSTFHFQKSCYSEYISNVPVPASNERVWRMQKTSSELSLYCDEILVGSFSRSTSFSCLSDYQWNNFGQDFFFYDDAVTHYRIISSSE